MTIEELKEMKIWFLWNLTPSLGNKEKMTKVPVSSVGGKTGTNDFYKNTWSTYNEAIRGKEKLGASGIGFKIPKGFYFLDVDQKDFHDSFVKQLLERHDSYAEISPSGRGIHILGTCNSSQLPLCYDEKKHGLMLKPEFYQKNPNNHVELYIGDVTNRYATFTGNTINSLPLTDGTKAVIETLDKEMRRNIRQIPKMERNNSEVEFDIACALRKQKNGEKFVKLYDQGDFSAYGSQSEADASLCSMIAFRTGNNPEAIDKVFRDSALYREKWEREDYRNSTIALGIKACNGNFHKSVMKRPEFILYDEQTNRESVSVPLLAKYVRENMKYIMVRDNGRQALLKYVYDDGCYRYHADNMMMGRIKQFIADYNEELVKMSKVNETLQHINTDLNYVSQEDLNADEDIINFQNGLLRVTETDMVLENHSPSVFSTIQLPCEWKGKAFPTPTFDSYLNTLSNGDKEVQQLLLEFIGACISNVKGSRMKKSLFLVGDGDTGKSQLKNLVERLLGKGNFIGIDLKEIEARFGTGSLYGTRLAGSSDMSFLSIDELKTFKKLTGGDSIFTEIKGQQGFESSYNGMLWFCMNRLPKFGGDDGKWVYDRIMVVKCTNVIPLEKQDKKLLDKMYEERDGIVYKAIKALQTVIANGYRFSEPESISAEREKYQKENNTVISFYEECMCERTDGRITDSCTTGRIYKVYKEWCRDNNNGYAKNYKEFRTILADHLSTDFEKMIVKRNSGTFYRDYTLTQGCKQDYATAYGFDSTEFLA